MWTRTLKPFNVVTIILMVCRSLIYNSFSKDVFSTGRWASVVVLITLSLFWYLTN